MKTRDRITGSGVVAILAMTVIAAAAAPDQTPGPHEIKMKDLLVRHGAAVGDRAVGLLDKGQLSNLISNFGVISNFHFGTPALKWPRNSTDVQYYGFGVGLLVLADGVLMSSIYDPSAASVDYTWEAADGSSGLHFNDQRTEENSASDEITPLMASSDRRATWPVIGGEPTWPGPFREDLDNPGVEVAGEFASDRDVYGVIQDTRGVGLRVEQIGYTYGRPYAEDFFFIRFLLHNDGAEELQEVYAGMNADLKPDFYADDRISAWKVDGSDNRPSFIFKQDINGVAQRDDSSHFDDWVGPVGWIGIGLVSSPNDSGITSFHYYHDDNSPVTDEDLAALMTNDTSAVENPQYYFHGDDLNFDDLSLQGDVDLDELPGSEITFIFATGPFNIPAGGVEEFAVLFAIGADSTDLWQNVETAYLMARQKAFQGSGPPATPTLRATPGDGQVLLTWDNLAESSIDAITEEADFEGYRIFKSTDEGETWGEPLTNWYGEPVGYVPLFQCDIEDSVTGLDPAYGPDFPAAHAWLGDDTGLRHSFLDLDVTNGIEVWYTITAYDRGTYDPDNPDQIEASYESPRGTSSSDQNTEAVVPGTRADNWVPGLVGGLEEISGLVADGQLEIEIVDESLLTGHTYQVTFNDSGDVVEVDGQSVEATETTLNLTDLDRGDGGSSIFTDMHSGASFSYVNIAMTGDDMPAVDGFRLIAWDIEEAGVRSLGWTNVGDTESTFDWWTVNRYPNNPSSYPEVVEGLDDWRITITNADVEFRTTEVGFGIGIQDTTFSAPLKIEKIRYPDMDTWVDVTQYMLISDLQFVFAGSEFVGPLGWDLIPGGAGYNPVSDPELGPLFPDMLILRDDENDTTGSLIWLKTNNGPPEGTAPSVGDVFTIVMNKPFSHDLTYEFTTESAQTSALENLANIKVVPNPFIVQSGLEQDENEARVMFTHLPASCDIAIYTVSGREVAAISHRSTSGDGFTYWDLRNKNGQDVAYGIYVYVVKTSAGNKHMGKLMVIR